MIRDIINRIKNGLEKTFDDVFDWFNKDDDLLDRCPKNGGWTIRQILEHISLTNYYLLILIRKGARKAIQKSKTNSYIDLLSDYDLDWNRLELIGQHGSFEWNRPAHMDPTGSVSLSQVKITLRSQLDECLDILNQIPNGEGILYKTTMTVNDLGKIDVYHYICFLEQHAKRHLSQMKKIKIEFEKDRQ